MDQHNQNKKTYSGNAFWNNPQPTSTSSPQTSENTVVNQPTPPSTTEQPKSVDSSPVVPTTEFHPVITSEKKSNTLSKKTGIIIGVIAAAIVVVVGTVIAIVMATSSPMTANDQSIAATQVVSQVEVYEDSNANIATDKSSDYILIQNDSAVSSESAKETQPVKGNTTASSIPESEIVQPTTKKIAPVFNYNTPFYGIWVNASKNYDDAVKFSEKVTSNGFNGFAEDTTDWSNLNSEKWYVVTAGKYASENEAKNELDKVKKYYPDAYIKYSGEYNSSNNYPAAFYGIWVSASKSYDDAVEFSENVTSNGFNGSVEETTDWSNLNSEKWYVVTAGKYASENEAKNKLKEVKKYYPDAYIKYSGVYIND